MEISRIFDIALNQLKNNPLDVAFCQKVRGDWKKTSTLQFVNQANKMSRGLLKMGIKPEDKIALISTTNRTEWAIMDLAIQQIGAVNVPVYPTISSKDYEYIFNEAEIKFCFVSDKELYDKVMVAKANVPSLVGTYSFDEIDGAPNWMEIMEMGEDDATQHEVENLRDLIKPEHLATIIYTSGTTGNPKGVMLSHENIVQNVMNSKERIPDFGGSPKALSFLPVCHIFERMILYLYQYQGISIYFAENLETIGDNLKEIHPQVMTVVPRLVEKVYNKIYDKGLAAGGIKTKLFLWAVSLVENYEPYGKMGFMEGLKYKIASKLVFSKWKEGVGGELVTMVSGSAALSPRLNHVFWGAGIPILEGYGLTETSPVISVNEMTPTGFAVGSVGKPLKNLEVKIASDGEILVKGPSVFKGYYKNEEKTKEVFTEDGYFMTGDIGEFDDVGRLRITDRKKEMFKTSGGKYVAPQLIENEFKQSQFIEQIMVVGDGEKMPCALIQPDFEFLKEYIKEKQINCEPTPEALVKNEQIIQRIEKEVEKLNHKLGKWEQIKRISLTPEVWGVENELLTPTLKLKRKVIKAYYQELYDKMYER